MLPVVADAINACLEFFAAAFILLSVRKLYLDKKVRGISWAHIAFFMCWGYWNLIYYPAVESLLSFKAGILVTIANTVYLLMLLYYMRRESLPTGYTTTKDKMFCETWSGKKFFVLDPDPESVVLEDIGHALGNICRYMGHTDGPRNGFYSVAEHCSLMSDWVLAQGWGVEKAFAAHIHDAGEPYSGDQPRPWKCAVPALRELENKVDNVVLPAIGGGAVKPKWLEEIDARIIMDERQQARRPSDNKWLTDDLEPLGVTIQFWTPEQASREWLHRYYDLSAAMGLYGSGGTDGVANIYP